MNVKAAIKIATLAGLECVWSATGQVWRAHNRTTGKHISFDACWLRGYGNARFQTNVDDIK